MFEGGRGCMPVAVGGGVTGGAVISTVGGKVAGAAGMAYGLGCC